MFRDDLHARIHRADEKIAALKTDIGLFCKNQQSDIQITPQAREDSAVVLACYLQFWLWQPLAQELLRELSWW